GELPAVRLQHVASRMARVVVQCRACAHGVLLRVSMTGAVAEWLASVCSRAHECLSLCGTPDDFTVRLCWYNTQPEVKFFERRARGGLAEPAPAPGEGDPWSLRAFRKGRPTPGEGQRATRPR